MHLGKKAALFGAATLAGLALTVGSAMAQTTVVSSDSLHGFSSDNYYFPASGGYVQGPDDLTKFSTTYNDPNAGGDGSLEITLPSTQFEAGFGLGVNTALSDTLGALTDVSYDYYRNSTSGVGELPALGLFDSTANAWIIYDPEVDSSDNWVQTGNIMTSSRFRDGDDRTFTYGTIDGLSNGKFKAGDTIETIELFGGSGWQNFSGAVDNFRVNSDVYDFAVAPEPSTMAAFGFIGLGVSSLILKARRRKAHSV